MDPGAWRSPPQGGLHLGVERSQTRLSSLTLDYLAWWWWELTFLEILSCFRYSEGYVLGINLHILLNPNCCSVTSLFYSLFVGSWWGGANSGGLTVLLIKTFASEIQTQVNQSPRTRLLLLLMIRWLEPVSDSVAVLVAFDSEKIQNFLFSSGGNRKMTLPHHGGCFSNTLDVYCTIISHVWLPSSWNVVSLTWDKQ